MATPENTFIGSVHRHLPKTLYHVKNNNQFHAGIADVWYSGDKADLWIEYKFEPIPKRDDTQVSINLSELQKNWLRSRHGEGRRVGVIVGCKEGGMWLPGVTWDAPHTAKQFRAMVVDRKSLAAMICALVSLDQN